jgi:malonyl-CoA O-methyltransferase
LRPPALALDWLRSQQVAAGGIKVASDRSDAYPEVTGYLIPTLLRYGETESAVRCLRWLAEVQQTDGSYLSPEGLSLAFDTAQALRGLLAGIGLEKQASECARRAAEYVYTELLENGGGGLAKRFWYRIPESVNLYALPALIRAGEVFHRPEYARAADRYLGEYLRAQRAFRPDILTHFLGYEVEALIDLGRADVAARALGRVRREQRRDGSVAGVEGASWVCTPGLAQLAICLYKTGQWPAADRALEWLEARQEPSGGFLGSYGEKSWYFPDAEIPWAAKFYLDANLLRIQAFFERTTVVIPRAIHESDGRVQAVVSSMRPRSRILDVGCGKGRYLRVLGKMYPDVECLGLDACETALEHLPEGASPVRGSMELMPYRAASFDLVFAVEAIEHSSNLPAAMREILRVTRPGGTVVVIDKQQAHWGSLECPPWEHWPDLEELAQLLRRECEDVHFQTVSYDDRQEADGLMIAWKGRKRMQPNSQVEPDTDAMRIVLEEREKREIQTSTKARTNPRSV